MSKKFAIINGLGLTLLIGGAFLLIQIIRSQQVSIQSAPSAPPAKVAITPKPTTPSIISGDPTELDIPSLDIDLSVIPGYYNSKTGQWTLSLSEAQYATVTPEPNNQSGATFIYGHYRKAVFAYLHNIQPNALAVVKTANGHSFYYQLAAVKVVDPTNSAAVFAPSAQPELILQTCTGVLFQNRQLFYFNLERVV